jgi:protein-histidine pros-kinase
MIARYGGDNGFGWQPNEIVAAQVVSVPFESATANAKREFRAFMILLVAVFAAAFLVVNLLLYRLVVRPVRRMALVADRVSQGDMSAGEFPQGGAMEIASVARSFERMRKSLEKALRLLGT